MQTLAFGADDLARTRFATSALGHLVHGVHNSPCGRRSPLRQRWWRTARRNVPAQAMPLVELINADPTRLPPFLLPMPAADPGVFEPTIDDELDYLRAASAEEITAALAMYDVPDRAPAASPADVSRNGGTNGREPGLIGELRDGTTRSIPRLVQAAQALFRACLADDWPDIRRRLHLDLSHRSRVFMGAGPGAVLETLHPSVRWESGRLLLPDTCGPIPGTAPGTGLTLMPFAFARDSVHLTSAQHGAPVLMYSAMATDGGHLRDRDTLATLIGAGRARALRALAVPASTSGLARRLGVSAPAASVHATVLREAGLIATHRDGRSVVHELTALGTGLLIANPSPPE
ncbi:ArsR/SmtB family transcription factor [Yinghuangia seranimata]|uniref:ArsR/SmtB family transcription factor n=1 Tax=Yinghuangia seranimata TaxID=408067 RepID=UPI00248CFBF3|nr:winged helix-turn-helix domain-containing protein [Yinghuangia seranimata]MDI2131297.1 winged helix-turn-helix domain-containing protein [Yinghuangia seranimata]